MAVVPRVTMAFSPKSGNSIALLLLNNPLDTITIKHTKSINTAIFIINFLTSGLPKKLFTDLIKPITLLFSTVFLYAFLLLFFLCNTIVPDEPPVNDFDFLSIVLIVPISFLKRSKCVSLVFSKIFIRVFPFSFILKNSLLSSAKLSKSSYLVF